jgi:transposase-like protein
MGRKRYTVEQIIGKLREAEVELGRGLKTPQVCRKLGISDQTYYRWRKQYGGMQISRPRLLDEVAGTMRACRPST